MLADNGQLSGRRVGMIVVDELHLLAEQKRGALLDATITKVLDSQQSKRMSATTGNMQEIGDFLNAHVCTRDFRPVKLTETIKLNEQIFVINKDVDGSLKSKLDRKLDFDPVLIHVYGNRKCRVQYGKCKRCAHTNRSSTHLGLNCVGYRVNTSRGSSIPLSSWESVVFESNNETRYNICC
eukprot:XP_016663895.1 PREDICTED: helicase POLQ-like [Acyrthosiphon pisum]